MTRADNTHHLRAAAHRRAQDARARANAALATMRDAGQPITPTSLARAAGVARSWVYTQPDLIAALRAAAPDPSRGLGRPRSRASEDSWQHRLTLAHARIRELTAENAQLRAQLAVTHGELRAARTIPRSP